MVVMRPHWGIDPGDGYPRAQDPPLDTASRLLARGACLEEHGQWRGQAPSSEKINHRVVKQGKSQGSAGTTNRLNRSQRYKGSVSAPGAHRASFLTRAPPVTF